jgi:hypothetical protein
MKDLRTWLRQIEELNIAPDSLTKRSFYSTLEGAKVGAELTDEFIGKGAEEYFAKSHHSLTAFIEELGVFLHPGDHEFVWVLCHVYDTPPILHHKTEHAGENLVHDVYFSMLSACTPKSLKDIFTEQALELGISARTMIIFSDEKIQVDIFGKVEGRGILESNLKHDLTRISRIQGEYQWETEAARELVDWVNAGMPPIPKDPRFEHYVSRRFTQFAKVCMCCAASKRQDPVVLPDDVFQAKTFLLDAERFMSEAVATVGANPYLVQQQNAIRLIHSVYSAEMRGVSESELRRRLSTDLDPRYTDYILNELERARWVVAVGKMPNRFFYPKGREPRIDTANGQGNTVKEDPDTSESD